jgi:PPK2 family polyphosphate:nucleotide phosphotransferase
MGKLYDPNNSARFISTFRVRPGHKISLRDFDPAYKPRGIEKDGAEELLQKQIEHLAEWQTRLFAQDTYSLLIVLQAPDAAGKDSVIKHVMTGLNPQGCEVHSFKAPSEEELTHDYLWRNMKALPARGRIGIFNRSYYEEVLVVRVHPETLSRQRLPKAKRDADIWKRRFSEINEFEKYLVNNGTEIVKIFLNVSKEEQKRRFLERIDRPAKNWKFSLADVAERQVWSSYQKVYEEMLSRTSTDWAPWYVIPADRKWFTRLAVAAVVANKLMEINPQYPSVGREREKQLAKVRKALRSEK